MILYHGSNVKISKPDLTYSKPFKDFGQGFYLSADEQQARNLAITNGRADENRRTDNKQVLI